MNKFSNAVAHLGYKKLVISKDILTCSEKAITILVLWHHNLKILDSYVKINMYII